MRDDRLRLEDVRDSVEQIEKYSARGRQAFNNDELIQVWIHHHLGIIGEACRGLSEAFRLRHPDEIWSNAISLRNVLVIITLVSTTRPFGQPSSETCLC
jgi:uncharacterized protein with HEPN domain